MKLSFNYQDKKIVYNLTYKKRSNISIQVEADGTVQVVAPVGTKVFTVMDKVKGNGAWITQELERIQREKEEVSKYTYLGKNYGVELVEVQDKDIPSVKLVRGKFVVEGSHLTNEVVRQAMCEWYKQKATSKLKEKLKNIKEEFNTVPKKLTTDVLKGQLYHIEDNAVVVDVNCAVASIYVLEYMLVGALCQFNKMTEQATNEKITALVEDYEAAQEWLQQGTSQYLFS